VALRILADIALRSLSPAINDPTSAVQALDGIDALLRRLATRTLKVGRIEGPMGTARVLLVLPTWDDYLGVRLDEIIGGQDATGECLATEVATTSVTEGRPTRPHSRGRSGSAPSRARA
jgi:uncharacterized membrane protein